MSIGGVASRYVPKGMSIELINWKNFQHIVQPGRTVVRVVIGRSGSTTKKNF